jgi:RNA polymerase sigma factor (sigma-70 family)
MQDPEVIERIRAGEMYAAQLLYRKYLRVLLSIGQQNGLVHADAEEVANDVFLSAFALIREGKLGSKPGPWLCKVMRNRAIDRVRHNKSSRDFESESLDEQYHTVNKHSGESRRPREVLRVQQALQHLTAADSKTEGPSVEATDLDILTWIAHGVTNEELADYLNTNSNAARQRKSRALKRLKQEMDRLQEFSESVAEVNA